MSRLKRNHTGYKLPGMLVVAMIITIVLTALAGCSSGDTYEDPWPDETRETKPWTRMWWMGNAINKDDLYRTIKEYAGSGLGGIEITPIYGVKGTEDQYIDFLSDEWIEMLLFTIGEAEKSGMGVDINLGTGWPYGGPHVTEKYGAKRITVNRYPDDSGYFFPGREVNINLLQTPGESLVALFAIYEDGTREDISEKTSDDGTLNWSPQSGNCSVYAAVASNTNQLVKRAAPGGEGLTVDPFSGEALEAYLDRFDRAFGDEQPAIRSMFNDSYEVYQANYTPLIFDVFEKRRGYDVRPWIKELSEREATDMNIRIQADYRETISDLLLEEFTIPWDEWIRRKNSISRLQAHGSPANLLDLYGASGIPEGEIFGSTIFPVKGFKKYTHDNRNPPPDPLMMKFASSAGNVTGKQLVSSETFTWAGEHFKVTLSELKPELEQVFLAGVNHIFYHGSSYIPESAEWPGWLFYASVQFNQRNSFWPHLQGMNEYITRCQSILQFATPDNELLVYWPVHDIWHQTGELDMLLTVHNVGNWLQPSEFYKTVSELTGKGYLADYVSGRQLENSVAGNGLIETTPGASKYKALIVPHVKYMPLEDIENILRLAEEGATVIFAGLPSDVPGFFEFSDRREELKSITGSLSFTDKGNGISEYDAGRGTVLLAGNLQQALEYRDIFREEMVDRGLQFTRRDHGEGKYYYIVNHTAEDIDTVIPVNSTGRSVVIMDPQDGRYGVAGTEGAGRGRTGMRVQIASGEALFIKTCGNRNRGMAEWRYFDEGRPEIVLDERWNLTFTNGGPVVPEMIILEELVPWTSLGGDDVRNYSGSAEYSTDVYLPELTAGEYRLCLGDVRESARVWVNGQDAGIAWSNPFRLKVGEYLNTGTNTIRIEVANLMANRISYMDREGIQWRNFHDINFVSLFYTPFDASDWEVFDSGLRGPVRLVPLTVH